MWEGGVNLGKFFNPWFTKPFGTHTLYQGGGGCWADPLLSQNLLPHEREIL